MSDESHGGGGPRSEADAEAVAAAHADALASLAAELVGDGRPAPRDAVGEWRTLFPGTVVTPGDPEYDDARRVWNGYVSAFPAAVAYPTTPAGVARVVDAAQETGLGIATRSGGHSSVGTSTGDGVLVCDVGAMRDVTVDPAAGTATVEPGATIGELDAATTEHALATPQGVAPEVGVTGLTLGGGTGYLSRAHGLACDRLRRVELVTAAGERARSSTARPRQRTGSGATRERVTASPARNPDLFRAVRGAGGDFGVAVELEFDLVPVPDEVAMCDTWFGVDGADEIAALLRAYRRLLRAAPRETNVSPYVARVPDEPGFTDDRAGDLALCVLGAHAGDPEAGERALAPFRDLARESERGTEEERESGDGTNRGGDATAPLIDHAERVPYRELQRYLGGDSAAGDRYYWKSVAVESFTDDLVALVAERMTALPGGAGAGPDSTVVVWPMGGAIADLDPGDTAVPERDAEVVLNFEACWSDPGADDEHVSWARESAESVREVATVTGELPNFSGTERGESAARDVYGDNYDWLRETKREWDPERVFSPSGRL
ncbi:FAD-binding oxidoreductase [Halobaculum magnesiiphilum]|uniref:FAD-binding oxidoreductase n=1 Tax=Halobaculum magnesiiphilum TaxID=1017351 RepID=A0A8T8W9B6_9EURY|nr:FAD-binding oxidoreductase [Halobaculum magnesiiphilum]QZP36374.1 FAD-binding oxidoreductase [Halobaculum magnesiiphilum]